MAVAAAEAVAGGMDGSCSGRGSGRRHEVVKMAVAGGNGQPAGSSSATQERTPMTKHCCDCNCCLPATTCLLCTASCSSTPMTKRSRQCMTKQAEHD